MNKLKFRYYYPNQVKGSNFIYSHENKQWKDGSDNIFISLINGEWAIGHDEDNHDWIIDEDKIQQFTGLKDKNGKDIYEGDILKYEETGSFGVMTWLVKTAQFGFSNGWANPVYGYTNVNEAVIIGNIFENPELLTNN